MISTDTVTVKCSDSLRALQKERKPVFTPVIYGWSQRCGERNARPHCLPRFHLFTGCRTNIKKKKKEKEFTLVTRSGTHTVIMKWTGSVVHPETQITWVSLDWQTRHYHLQRCTEGGAGAGVSSTK